MSEPVSPEQQPETPPPGVGPRRRRATPLWVKLWSLVVTANLGGILVAIWVGRIIRGIPDSAALETGLQVAYYASILVVAVLDALLIDELVFGGAFRLTHIQGKSSQFSKNDEDVDQVAASMQRSTMSFPFAVLVCTILTYLLFNTVNDDFDSYYQQVGTHVSDLRGDDPSQREQRLQAIAALSIRRRPEVLPILIRQLERDGEVAAWAAWALGRHTDLARRRRLWAPLVAAYRSDDPKLRREALIALGRLQHRSMAEHLVDAVENELQGEGSVDRRLLYGLGSVQVLSSVPVLESVLHRGREDAQRMAAWALAQHRDQRGGRQVVDLLEERLPSASLEVRCAIIHALGILADERSNLALIRAYDRADAAQRVAICPRIQIYMRPDRRGDRIDLLMPQRTFARKILDSMGQMRATTPEIRNQVEPWLEELILEEDTPPAIADAARNLLEGIREQRDDRHMKSVDDAVSEMQ